MSKCYYRFKRYHTQQKEKNQFFSIILINILILIHSFITNNFRIIKIGKLSKVIILIILIENKNM